MKLKPIAANQNEVELADGTQAQHRSAQHTPGPWYAEQPLKIQIRTHSPRQQYRDVVAQIYECDGGQETREANARLIAAAPELLAACEEAVKHVAMNAMVYGVIFRAIARAKGEM